MTIKELYNILQELIEQGKDDAVVLLDTEASYDYHMASIATAIFEDEPIPHLALHER